MGIGVVVVACLVAAFWMTRRQPAAGTPPTSEQSDEPKFLDTRGEPPSLLKKKVHFADAGDEEFVHAPISIEQD